MKINTTEVLQGLDNKDITFEDKSFTVGMALSNILLSAKEGGKMKMFVLAQDMFNKEEVEVDTADLQLIKRMVENAEGMSNLITGQLLVMLSKEK